MFSLRSLISLLLIGTLSNLFAQDMVMNSGTKEAKQLIEEALANMGHDMQLFGTNIFKATEADPTMVTANFLEAMNPEYSEKESKVYLDRMQAYEGELSEGEAIMVEMSGHIWEKEYDFASAMSRLTDLYPGDAKLHLFVGASYLYANQATKSISHLEQARDLAELPGAYNMLGYAYMEMGNMEKAKESFVQYLKAAPAHYNPYDSMGDYLMAVEEYAAAATSFEKAASLNPDFPDMQKKPKRHVR